MADESSGEKTEMPTEKKLRDAREKGQVCTSKDIVSTALLIVMFVMVAIFSVMMVNDFSGLIGFVGQRLGGEPGGAMREGGKAAAIFICKYTFVFVIVAAVVGIAANVAQVGFLFTLEPLKPNLSKLNPAEGFKKIFCMKNFFEFFKNVVKVTFLSYLIYKIILASIPELLTMCYGTIDDIFPCLRLMLKRLAYYTVFGYVVIAVVDRLFQQKNFTKEMMMTKDEVKREYKEMEGSQEVKQAQRQFRNELLNSPNPAPATRQASVVVTNPTRLAIGIRYNAEESPLPRVVVAGEGGHAKTIRETAMAEGIPVVENVPLARALWANGKVQEVIPDELLVPVAEILKWVKQLSEAKKEEAELDEIQL
ncbi:MAG: type III secretion system export apparatus subunit SctU [Kiritimatiellae bacterium]|nr:type III secretion system export apparatus subunit SctU [Kiritimatiellia bacterium]